MPVRILLIVLMLAGCGGSASSQPGPTTSAAAPSPVTADFSGTGTKLLQPVTLDADTNVEWTNDGSLFMLILMAGPGAGVNPQLVVSEAASGSTYLKAGGTYEFKVGATPDSDWTLDFDTY